MHVIRGLRKHAGMTLEDLADRVQMHFSVLSRIETGHRRLYVEELSLFATALGCTVQDLLGEETKETPTNV